MSESIHDQWFAWLRQRRYGGDPQELDRTLDRLAKVRDRVLSNAQIEAGDVVLDVGTGEGLVAFGALDHVGHSGHVIFSDVSQELLDHARELATHIGVADRCRFLRASADDLATIPDASVDVVTTRSVLAYVSRKQQALAEFARVLKPGGRISLYEPVNRLLYPEPEHLFDGYDITPLQNLAERINTAYTARQPIDSDPMFDYDERDLMAFAATAGFGERHLELHVDVMQQHSRNWETYMRSSANPLAPTLEEAMAETLTPAETERFVAHLRPLVERGDGSFAVAIAYLWAKKS